MAGIISKINDRHRTMDAGNSGNTKWDKHKKVYTQAYHIQIARTKHKEKSSKKPGKGYFTIRGVRIKKLHLTSCQKPH